MPTNFDFDYLSELYQTDPEKFEEWRTKEIAKVIDGASEERQKRLRGIQFQIDAKRNMHKDSPIGSCIAISKMMHESFENFRFHLNQFTDKQDPLGRQWVNCETKLSQESPAQVIQLHR